VLITSFLRAAGSKALAEAWNVSTLTFLNDFGPFRAANLAAWPAS
jgi:hypothetical protein